MIVGDTENSPIVEGEVAERMILQEGSFRANNEFGMDTLTRPYKVLRSQTDKLMPRFGAQDPFIPHMRLTDYTVIEARGPFDIATLVYKGLIDDKLPPVVIEGGWSEAVTQLTTTSKPPNRTDLDPGRGNTDEDEEGEVSVTFHSPQTTFLYITRKQPKGPKFRGVMMAGIVDFEIIDISPAIFRGRLLYDRIIRTVDFKVNRAGAYFECRQVNQGFLVNRKVYLTLEQKYILEVRQTMETASSNTR